VSSSRFSIDDACNFGALSHISVSFEALKYTTNSDALGTLRIMEVARILVLSKKTCIYRVGTSELYVLEQEIT
jgi:GDPmannose 4,6-dehydratase